MLTQVPKMVSLELRVNWGSWVSDLRGFGLSVCERQSKRVSDRTWFFRSQQRTERERERVCVQRRKDGLSGAHFRLYM